MLIEEQITYPLVTSMLGAPRVKAVRGFSDFGYSFVHVIFQEGTDLYSARSRTLEYLSGTCRDCRRGLRPNWDQTLRGWAGYFSTRLWTNRESGLSQTFGRIKTGTSSII